jgi:uncharacterized protein involved in high-affinity Fe2+ transport
VKTLLGLIAILILATTLRAQETGMNISPFPTGASTQKIDFHVGSVELQEITYRFPGDHWGVRNSDTKVEARIRFFCHKGQDQQVQVTLEVLDGDEVIAHAVVWSVVEETDHRTEKVAWVIPTAQLKPTLRLRITMTTSLG